MLVPATILNLLPFGVLGVSAKGVVVLSNAIARELLKDGGALSIKDGLLATGSKVYQKTLSEAITHASGKERQSSGFSMARPALPPFLFRLCPLTAGKPHRAMAPRAKL